MATDLPLHAWRWLSGEAKRCSVGPRASSAQASRESRRFLCVGDRSGDLYFDQHFATGVDQMVISGLRVILELSRKPLITVATQANDQSEDSAFESRPSSRALPFQNGQSQP